MDTGYRNRPRDEAAEKIECYIIENSLAPHDRLPSERDMCDMWNLNRTTLRSAIYRLAGENVIYNKPGSGTFVAPPKLVRNLQDIKGFSDVVKQSGYAIRTKIVRKKVQEASKKIAQNLHLPLAHSVLELVRVRYVNGNPVLLENSYVDAERFTDIQNHDFSEESLYSVLEYEYGVKFGHGRERLNVTYMDAEEAELLETRENATALYQSGVVSDDKDVPVEYFSSIARPEFIKFASVLIR